MRMANRIVDEAQVPVLVINGAQGQTSIAQHQRSEDLETIYGRMLWRARQAGVAESIRAIFWHQGEEDGEMTFEEYGDLWWAMYEDWLSDYTGVEGVFVFQIRAGCGNPVWNRNFQRELPGLPQPAGLHHPAFIRNMSTTGIDGHDGCHFFHRAYEQWGERMARLVLRDLYAVADPRNIDAPNPQSATWEAGDTRLVIEFGETGDGLRLEAGAEAWFHLSDGAAIASVDVYGTTVVITTQEPSGADSVTFAETLDLFDGDPNDEEDVPWLVNDLENGLEIGAFAFHEFPTIPSL